MSLDVSFYGLDLFWGDGRSGQALVGFARDGTMWLDARDLGVGPQHGPLLIGRIEEVVRVDNTRNLIFIEARAVAGLLADPQERRVWLTKVETLTKKFLRQCELHDAAPNN